MALFTKKKSHSFAPKFWSMVLAFAIIFTAAIPALSTGMIASAAAWDEITVVRINGSSVRVRSGPSTASTTLATYNQLATFMYVSEVTGQTVSGNNSKWYKVQYGTGTSDGASGYGYIYSGNSTKNTLSAWAYARVTGTSVYVRRGPSTNFGSMTMTTTGNTYDVFSSSTDSSGNVWYLVKIENRVGYIIASYLRVTNY